MRTVTESTEPLYQKVKTELLEKIHSGEWAANQKIPTEKELAELFGVSQITARRAVLDLVQDRKLFRIAGKGTFVTLPDEWLDDREPGAAAGHMSGVANSGAAGHTSAIGNSGDADNPGGAGEASSTTVVAAKGRSVEIARQTLTVGVIIHQLRGEFQMSILNGVDQTLREAGAFMMYAGVGDIEEEKRSIRKLVEAGAEGLIVYPSYNQNYNDEIMRLALNEFPIVLVDRYMQGIDVLSVSSDNFEGGKLMTHHLIEMGHKELAFVTSDYSLTSSVDDRIAGFETAMTEAGLLFNRNHFFSGVQRARDYEDIYNEENLEAVRQFLRGNPSVTGIVAAQDHVALVVIRAAQSMGIRVPEQLSVVGFDDHPLGALLATPLTTVRQSGERIGQEACRQLVRLLAGEEVLTRKMQVPVELVVRNSTAPPPL